MRSSLLSALLLGAMVVTACDSELFDVQDEDLVVVRAFLYAGEPVWDVKLTRTTLLGSEEDPAPISDAEVVVIEGGVAFELIPTVDSPGFYHYPGTDLEVVSGDRFRLEIHFNGDLISAETVVPFPPEGLALSSDQLEIPDMGGGFGGRPGFMADPLVVRWSNLEGLTFFLTVDNLELDPEPLPFTELLLKKSIRFTSSPVTTDSMYVNALSLTHYGAHELTLYQVNSEYSDLYQGRTQDSRDLNEPPSNIQGGLGVFSAFAGTRAYFVAMKEG